eukprot:COSAG02_NODE_1345_length_13143_cov_61.223091_8_plen_123_part_00
MVFGRRLNLHPVVVLFALVFWYMMWGIPGAFLSVPIVSVLKILCLNMDNLTAQWFARLLGAPPAVCRQPVRQGSCTGAEKFACAQKVMWKSTAQASPVSTTRTTHQNFEKGKISCVGKRYGV